MQGVSASYAFFLQVHSIFQHVLRDVHVVPPRCDRWKGFVSFILSLIRHCCHGDPSKQVCFCLNSFMINFCFSSSATQNEGIESSRSMSCRRTHNTGPIVFLSNHLDVVYAHGQEKLRCSMDVKTFQSGYLVAQLCVRRTSSHLLPQSTTAKRNFPSRFEGPSLSRISPCAPSLMAFSPHRRMAHTRVARRLVFRGKGQTQCVTSRGVLYPHPLMERLLWKPAHTLHVPVPVPLGDHLPVPERDMLGIPTRLLRAPE